MTYNHSVCNHSKLQWWWTNGGYDQSRVLTIPTALHSCDWGAWQLVHIYKHLQSIGKPAVKVTVPPPTLFQPLALTSPQALPHSHAPCPTCYASGASSGILCDLCPPVALPLTYTPDLATSLTHSLSTTLAAPLLCTPLLPSPHGSSHLLAC